MFLKIALVGIIAAGCLAVPALAGAASPGSAYRWGSFAGKGDTQLSPSAVSGLSGISYVNAGNSADYFIASGLLYASGENTDGQLGQGTVSSKKVLVTSPEVVPGLSSMVQVANGANFAIAINASGQAFGWGADDNGKLCTGTTQPYVASPVQVTAFDGEDVVGVAAGGNHSAFLLSDGTVWSCGANSNGELGDGSTTSSTVPVQATGIGGVSKITSGSSFTTALINGALFDWGNNSNGELGANLTAKYSDVPVQVIGLSGVTVFGAGGNSGSSGHQLALTSDGTLWGWGDDLYGQLGDGKSKSKVGSPVKAKLLSAALGEDNVTGLALGAGDSFVLDSAGQVYAIGENTDGSLGSGGTSNSSTPILIDNSVGMVSATSNNAVDLHP
jgi:alpha-tubulin suppressor-like RCC1 family protein